MAMSDVKLLGSRTSPYVHRVQIALNIKCINYEFLEETFGSKSELLLKSNPVHKMVPVLIHDNKPICESLIIVQYIHEVWTSSGPSILPSDPYDLATALFWGAFIDDEWSPSVTEAWMAREEEAKATAMERVAEGLALLEEAFVKCSKGKAFFGGDSIGYLDIAFGSCLGGLRVAENMGGVLLLDEAKTPGLVGWAERFSSDDSVKDVIIPTEKLIELVKVHQARAKPPISN
ncbi:glutathione S-transferase U17-like [Cornus florida]|uniref:glutathione S-transferase U17-like n=1 Tax=Cornus florida TaxID=4283 RepID=UPI0028A17581|nr:glutathione S-transferase U17-like [Cornus florida]